jgi:ribosomal protein S18 acetylase RimI-like enzyme
MIPVRTADEVLTAIQKVKAAAPAFCTNFFPAQKKLQDWIAQGELMSETRDGAAFFFKKDRDLWHFYFCGASVAMLRHEMANLPVLKTERMVTDLVGSETALAKVMVSLEEAGFRKYSHLQRMARTGGAGAVAAGGEDAPVVFADASDRKAILDLLESSFDHCADQLPAPYEIDAAIAARQIFTIKCDDELAAMLFFETQGFTSTIRYWVVARRFQSKRLGASLMRHYLATHSAVRRFVLWVVATNENAVKKYQHYGYVADGLIDHVLVNEMIQR